MKIMLLGSLVSLSCFAGIPQLQLSTVPSNITNNQSHYHCYAPPIYVIALDNSMRQSGIEKNDILELDAGGRLRIGALVAVKYSNDKGKKDLFTCGKLQKSETFLFKIQPDDPKYDSFSFQYAQVFTISRIIKSRKSIYE